MTDTESNILFNNLSLSLMVIRLPYILHTRFNLLLKSQYRQRTEEFNKPDFRALRAISLHYAVFQLNSTLSSKEHHPTDRR